jgi:[amino group carrier protein]-lysine/ornithine hydrolase
MATPDQDFALLEGLVSCYSPTGEESEAVDFLVAEMSMLGFKAGADGAGNAVGSLGDGPREIILLGHIDTVPGEITVQREEDILRGRGTVDAKGPLSCFTCAAARVGATPGWRITVIGAVGEEGDSRGAKFLRADHPDSPEMVVIGEPSGSKRVTLGYKGSAWFDYKVCRPLAHTAGHAESACEAAVKYWAHVHEWTEEYNQGRERIFEQISLTLRGMDSGSDGFSEWAELNIGTRLPLGMGVPEIQTAMSMVSGYEGGQDPGSLTMLDGVPAYRSGKNNALVRAFLKSIRAFGGKPGFSLKTGTSDMNIVGPAWGCPIVAYGPGDSSLDHTPDEHIHVSEYMDSIDILEEVLREISA